MNHRFWLLLRNSCGVMGPHTQLLSSTSTHLSSLLHPKACQPPGVLEACSQSGRKPQEGRAWTCPTLLNPRRGAGQWPALKKCLSPGLKDASLLVPPLLWKAVLSAPGLKPSSRALPDRL